MANLIYVVEDDPDVREMYAQALVDSGYTVREFPTAETCVETINNGLWPDALLVDNVLPKMTGLDLVQYARSHHLECPVVMITGHRSIPMDIKSIGLGLHTTIEKPCPIDVIVEELAKAIHHYHNVVLNRELIGEFEYFSNCAETLIAAYQRQITELKDQVGEPSRKIQIMQQECQRWQKEITKSHAVLERMKDRLSKLNHSQQNPFKKHG